MKRKEKGKKRLTRKSKVIISILLSLFIIIVGLFYFYPLFKLRDVENSYSNVVEIEENTVVYQKDKNEYLEKGKIKKGTILELAEKEESDYFKIKGTDYYIYYDNVKKSKDEITFNNNILDFNQNVTTSDKTNFYKDGKLVLELNSGVSLPIKEMDNEYYYVYYGNIFALKKDEVQVIENQNNDMLETNYISVIHYENIKDTCEDVKCVMISDFKEQLKYLKEQGYYTIDLEAYKKWLNGNVRLKEKAILLTSTNFDDNINSILKEYEFSINKLNDELTFSDTNEKTTRDNKDNLSRYIVTKSIDLEKYKKIVAGESFINVDLLDPNDLATEIGVLNYHFFYDSSLGEGCNEQICLDTKDFEEQLKYLKDNGYRTLTIEEFRAWMYGEIELPKKSVLLTIDDGAMGTGKHNGNKLIPLLEKYDMHATLFLITGWWDISNYESPNLDVQSHTNNMHTAGLCSAFRGAQILCSTKEQVIDDLTKSLEITGSNTSFCFPFYAYDDQAIDYVKEVGFKMAFVGGEYKASRNDDKYKVPRYPIYKNTTLDEFISMIS